MGLTNDHIINILIQKIPQVSTRDIYINRITTLSKQLHASIYDIVKDPDTYFPKIRVLYNSISTQKNLVTVILVIFNNIPLLMSKKKHALTMWQAIHHTLRINYTAPTSCSITRDEIVHKYNTLHKHNQKQLLLSMILHLKNQHHDYSNVAIVRPPEHISPSTDYIVLKTLNPYMVLQKRKYAIQPQLLQDINTSLSKSPRNYLFTSKDSFMKPNSYNVFVIRTFEKLFNKKVGVNQLRLMK